jgi:subtilisin family serine protease
MRWGAALAAFACAQVLGAGPSSGREPPPSPTRAAAAEPPRILIMLRMAPPHYRPEASYGGGYGDDQSRAGRRRIAQRLARQQGATVVDEWPMPLLNVDCFVVAAPAGHSAQDAAERIAEDPAVAWSEPMHTYHAQGEATHNDPLYPVQPAAREWRLAALHQSVTGRDVRVAVIDSAVDSAQPDLAGQVEVNDNFVTGRPNRPEGHGTEVAGLIAARADNRLGIAGVAPQARLMALRACWQEPAQPGARAATVCDSLSLAKALEYAIDHKAQVINMSLSGPPDQLLGRLLDVAIARDIAVVAAFDRKAERGGFPASHHGVVAVVDEEGGRPPPGVIAAPGRDIPTTEPGGRWDLVNGSSFAAAHVSGLFALMRQRSPRLHYASALVLTPPGETIDACATLFRGPEPCHCSCDSHDVLASAGR